VHAANLLGAILRRKGRSLRIGQSCLYAIDDEVAAMSLAMLTNRILI
jgi:hypothetical protein